MNIDELQRHALNLETQLNMAIHARVAAERKTTIAEENLALTLDERDHAISQLKNSAARTKRAVDKNKRLRVEMETMKAKNFTKIVDVAAREANTRLRKENAVLQRKLEDLGGKDACTVEIECDMRWLNALSQIVSIPKDDEMLHPGNIYQAIQNRFDDMRAKGHRRGKREGYLNGLIKARQAADGVSRELTVPDFVAHHGARAGIAAVRDRIVRFIGEVD